MGVIVIGDRNRACFACDTEMQAFGPVHVNSGAGSAKGEMRDFRDQLDGDARRLARDGVLTDMYYDWKREVLEERM